MRSRAYTPAPGTSTRGRFDGPRRETRATCSEDRTAGPGTRCAGYRDAEGPRARSSNAIGQRGRCQLAAECIEDRHPAGRCSRRAAASSAAGSARRRTTGTTRHGSPPPGRRRSSAENSRSKNDIPCVRRFAEVERRRAAEKGQQRQPVLDAEPVAVEFQAGHPHDGRILLGIDAARRASSEPPITSQVPSVQGPEICGQDQSESSGSEGRSLARVRLEHRPQLELASAVEHDRAAERGRPDMVQRLPSTLEM